LNLENADSLGEWLLIAFLVITALLVIVNQVRSLFRQEPPADQKYAPKRETADAMSACKLSMGQRIEKVERDVAGIKETVDARFREAATASSASRDKIYAKVNETREHVAALTAETATQGQRINQMDTKLDTIIDRVGRLSSKEK